MFQPCPTDFKFLTTIDIFSASQNKKIHFANLHNKYLVKRESDAQIHKEQHKIIWYIFYISYASNHAWPGIGWELLIHLSQKLGNVKYLRL